MIQIPSGSAWRDREGAGRHQVARRGLALITGRYPGLRQLPNAISLSRIAMGAIFLCVYSNSERFWYVAGLLILAVALASDFCDGILARRLRLESELGYVLDGLGDRSFYVAIILVIAFEHSLDLVLVWLLLFREIALYGGRLLISGWKEKNRQVRSLSRIHALTIRLWFLTYLLEDAALVFDWPQLATHAAYPWVQATLLALTLGSSYFALFLVGRLALTSQTEAWSEK